MGLPPMPGPGFRDPRRLAGNAATVRVNDSPGQPTILGTILGVGQLLATFVSTELSTFLAAAVALPVVYPLSRWRRFAEPVEGISERPAMTERAMSEQTEAPPLIGMAMSFVPYTVLTAVTLSILLIPSLNAGLRQVRIGCHSQR